MLGILILNQNLDNETINNSCFYTHDFNFDAVAVRMQENNSNPDLPMLGVYEVFKVLSEDLSLPFKIQ